MEESKKPSAPGLHAVNPQVRSTLPPEDLEGLLRRVIVKQEVLARDYEHLVELTAENTAMLKGVRHDQAVTSGQIGALLSEMRAVKELLIEIMGRLPDK
jgi:hypothetical protein